MNDSTLDSLDILVVDGRGVFTERATDVPSDLDLSQTPAPTHNELS